MPPLSMLIKPASSNCNLRCKYCFYHSLAESRNTKSLGMMSIDDLDLLVKKAFDYAEGSCTFAFQGGEPTLVGLDFFKKLIELQMKYNINKIKVNNAIQTNGIIIDDEWAVFLAKNKFLVGVSLDGTKEIHDMNRINAKNNGTFDYVMNAIKLFNKHKVEYNILTVVNALTARHISKIYNFYKKNNLNYLQFIPCLDPLEEKLGGHEYSLTPKKYTFFLKTLFDLWYEDIMKGKRISIRYFENLVGMCMGYPPEACGMSGVCDCYYVVEAEGSTYPCDFYVLDEWNIGNVKVNSFDEMRNSEPAKKFVEASRHIDPKCKQCKWINICRGGCRRTREPFENEQPVLNYYCESYKEFFKYSIERINKIALQSRGMKIE